MAIAIIRFNEELGDNQSHKPNLAGTAFVGLQSTVRNFTLFEQTTGEGYLLLSVAGMQNEKAQVLINGIELPGQNFDPIPLSNVFITTIVHVHRGLRIGANTIQFKNAPRSKDNWVINHVVVHSVDARFIVK